MATFSDSFAGTALSSDWATRRGTFVVASNNFYGSTNGASFAEVATATADFSDDHSAQVTYTAVATSDYAGPAVRVSASGCYAIRADGFSSSSRRIVKVNSAGTVTAIGTANIQPTTSDTVKLEVSGTTITAYKNGSQVDQVTDSTYSTGQPGIFYFRDNNGVTRCGSFSAADVASGPTLTDVDTDETIVPGQTGVVATGTNLSDGASARWVDANANVLTMTNYSAHATAPTFDVPNLATTLAAGVKFGSGDFEIWSA